MHDQYGVAGGQRRQPGRYTRNLIDEALAVRWAIARLRMPEGLIGRFELCSELIVTSSRPCTEVLLTEVRHFDGIETKSQRCLPGATRRAAERDVLKGQCGQVRGNRRERPMSQSPTGEHRRGPGVSA
jgi:hypothetical protein